MTQQEARDVCQLLQTKFDAEVAMDERSPGRFRFAVLSPLFEGVPPLKRQDRIWVAVEKSLTRELRFDISIIYTFAPGEIESVDDYRGLQHV